MGRELNEYQWHIEWRDPQSLIPYENNAKLHDGRNVTNIATSIRKYGWQSYAVITKGGIVIIGHGRRLAAIELGCRIPCKVIEDDLTDEEIRELRNADNLTQDGQYDMELLKKEFDELDFSDFDFDLDLPGSELEAHEDNFDIGEELQNPCFSKTGDVWHLGRHTVICGDSTQKDTYNVLLGGSLVNLVCTDAPYFVDLESASGKIKNDNLDDKSAYNFLLKVFKNFKASMRKDASIYEFYAIMKARIFYDAFEDAGFKVGAGLIWKKPRAPLMRTDWKFNSEPIIFGWHKAEKPIYESEPIIYGWMRDGKHIWYGDQKQTNVFEFDSIKNSKKDGFNHPSSKPVPLIGYLIEQASKPGDSVLDGFLGSASTLIACDQLERTCFGIEIEPKFVDVAVKRYMASHDDSDADVYCIRDGQRISYSDAISQIVA